MKSLFDFAKDIYQQLPKHTELGPESTSLIKNYSFEKLMDDDEKCLELINSIIEFESEKTYVNRDRASHIIITWLLGLGLSSYLHLDKGLDNLSILNNSKVWLQSAILHDYGYFCKEIKSKIPLAEITKDYNLLIDYYEDEMLSCLNKISSDVNYHNYFTYDYDEIRNYYLCKHKYWQTKNELSDHGIVGGCIAFRKYCKAIKSKKYIPDDSLTIIQKIACIIAASHNIFKSSKDYDSKYEEFGLYNLTSDAPVRVTRKNHILLLLSLVDTIECTKRFSKRNTPDEFLQQSTTLKKVGIELKDNIVVVDFSGLKSFILKERKSNNMAEKLEKHLSALSNIGYWTDFSAIQAGDIISIRLKEA